MAKGMDMGRKMLKARGVFSVAMVGILAIIVIMHFNQLAVALPGGRESVPNAQNDKELQKLAKFAVSEYSSQKGLKLKYLTLLSAEQQVVSGMIYYLHLKARPNRGKTCTYEARVWVQAWRNFKALQDFTLEQCS